MWEVKSGVGWVGGERGGGVIYLRPVVSVVCRVQEASVSWV